MAFYGEIVDDSYDPRKQEVYPLFTSYFNNPQMTKIKNVNNYSMYMTKIHAILGIEFRYLIVLCIQDGQPNGVKKFLSEIEWDSLQTRTLQEDHNHLPPHSYIPKRLLGLDNKIRLTGRDEKQYSYLVEKMPLKITLLTKSKNIDYNSTGSVVNALETYQTIVSFE